MKLKIIIASTRPGRKGPAIAQWMYGVAKTHARFDVDLLDLATINLPMMDEPQHPRMMQYTHAHTKAWSSMVSDADAFVIVTPEYNFGYPAALKNALDYLYNEWNYKPVGFASYGGVAAGTRAVQQLKQVVTAQKMMPVAESVNIPFFTRYMDEEERFAGDEGLERAAKDMLDEIYKWANALQPVRNK